MNALVLFLVGMALAVATVIFIHLFFRRVSKTVPFTYTWLLKRTLQQIKRRRRLQHLLILLLRTGTIAFVTMALVSFFYKPESIDIPTVVVLDNSASMTRGNPPLVWQGIKWTEENVNKLLFVITCDDIIREKENLSGVATYYGFCSLDKQFTHLTITNDSLNVYVVSDFQHGYWSELISRPFIPVVMNGESDNAWIDSMWLGEDKFLIVKWNNTGSADVSMQIKLNGQVKAVKKWRVQDSIQYDTVVLKPEKKINTVHIVISGDNAYFDNEFYAVIGSYPVKVYVHLTDTSIPFVEVLRKDTMFQFASRPDNADVILAGFWDDMPESTRKALMEHNVPSIILHKSVGKAQRLWLNRRATFWKGVLQDYGKAPIPLSVSAGCPSISLNGIPLLFTDSCVIASVDNKTLHVTYSSKNVALSTHPVFLAMIFKVLFENKAYELRYHRNDEQFMIYLTSQDVSVVPYGNSDAREIKYPLKPDFYYIIDGTDTMLTGINLPKQESILAQNVPIVDNVIVPESKRFLSYIPYLLLSFALILLLVESVVLRKSNQDEESAS